VAASASPDLTGPPELDGDLRQRIVDSLDDGVYFTDRERRIGYWAGGAERITGYTADEMIGRHCFANLLDHVDETGANLCLARCPLAATIHDGRRRQATVYLRHRDGHRVPVRVRTSPVRDANGRVIGATEIFSDETRGAARPADLAELRRLAFGDAVTGLPNRAYADRAIRGRLASLQRRGWAFGLILADVDRFKAINDEHGHLVGDAALRVVAKTMAAASRPEDVVARWGGDEFVVVVTAADAHDLLAVAQRLRALVSRSRPHVDGHPIRVSISVGGAVALPDDGVDALFERADRALYAAKEAGRNSACVLDGDRMHLAPGHAPRPEGGPDDPAGPAGHAGHDERDEHYEHEGRGGHDADRVATPGPESGGRDPATPASV
jgi:diguanylate cyclase (GGDEF)-like protein/PAS domain S-box-containing protein